MTQKYSTSEKVFLNEVHFSVPGLDVAVGRIDGKKYSNRNYTHTLESSCLCQVAEINVAFTLGTRALCAPIARVSCWSVYDFFCLKKIVLKVGFVSKKLWILKFINFLLKKNIFFLLSKKISSKILIFSRVFAKKKSDGRSNFLWNQTTVNTPKCFFFQNVLQLHTLIQGINCN